MSYDDLIFIYLPVCKMNTEQDKPVCCSTNAHELEEVSANVWTVTLKSLRPKSKGTFFDLKEFYVDFIDACTSFKKRQNMHLKLAFSSFSMYVIYCRISFFPLLSHTSKTPYDRWFLGPIFDNNWFLMGEWWKKHLF